MQKKYFKALKKNPSKSWLSFKLELCLFTLIILQTFQVKTLIKSFRSGIFIVNFEHISHLILMFLLLTLNMELPAGKDLFSLDFLSTNKVH